MSHPFGDLLAQSLHRKHSLSQSKLVEGILQDPSIIGKMGKGERVRILQQLAAQPVSPPTPVIPTIRHTNLRAPLTSFVERRPWPRPVAPIFHHPVGLMFWFTRNRLFGSYLFLMDTSRP